VFAQITSVAFNGFTLVVADALRIGFDKTAIENTSGQAFVVVGFDRFQVMDRDSRLLANLAQAIPRSSRASRNCSPILGAISSLDPGVGFVGLFTPGLTARRLYECVQLPLFLHYSLRC